MSSIQHWREWKKRHPEFPLTAAPCGQWAKKVGGHTYYFGKLDDPQQALSLWLTEKDYLLTGLAPPSTYVGRMVAEILEAYIAELERRVAAGKASQGTIKWYTPLRSLFVNAGVAAYPVSQMGPPQFLQVLRTIESSGLSLRTQKNRILAIRTLFRWASDMGYTREVKFGPGFAPPRLDDIDAEREALGRSRFIPREAILAVLNQADVKLRLMVLLGINCAFYASDSIAIPRSALHLDGSIPYHDFRRPKNRRRRMAVLWPETVQTIKEYLAVANHAPGVNALLVNKDGRPYSGKAAAKKMGDAFVRKLANAGYDLPGAGIGSLRHTYASVVDDHPDQTMIDLTMGHAHSGMRRRVYRQVNLQELERLQSIAERVRQWLFA